MLVWARLRDLFPGIDTKACHCTVPGCTGRCVRVFRCGLIAITLMTRIVFSIIVLMMIINIIVSIDMIMIVTVIFTLCSCVRIIIIYVVISVSIIVIVIIIMVISSIMLSIVSIGTIIIVVFISSLGKTCAFPRTSTTSPPLSHSNSLLSLSHSCLFLVPVPLFASP